MVKTADGEGAGLLWFQEFLKSELNELQDRIMAALSSPSCNVAEAFARSSAGVAASGDAEPSPGSASSNLLQRWSSDSTAPCEGEGAAHGERETHDSTVPLERTPRDVPTSPCGAIVTRGDNLTVVAGKSGDSPTASNVAGTNVPCCHDSGPGSLLLRRGRSTYSLAPPALLDRQVSDSTCQAKAGKDVHMGVFRLLDVWQDEIERQKKLELATPKRNRSSTETASRSHITPSEDRKRRPLQDGQAALSKYEEQCSRWFKYLVQEPNSRFRLCWDMIGMALIGYDLVTIPLQIFMLPETQTTIVLSWFLRVFWTADIPMSFLVGFHKAGALIMSPARIAKHYCRSWLALDLFLVSLEWFLAAIEKHAASEDAMESMGLARLGKTMRVLRILRILRLVRLIKLPRYIGLLEEHIQSEYVTVLLGIAKLTTCILIINHLVACCWYGVGVYLVPDDEFGWVEIFGLHNATVEYKYFTSMHWSLTQFTPASMEVTPTNVNERAFDVCVVVFALVTFSSFVSSITNAMTKLRNMNGEYERLFGVFRLFMRRHKISTSLMVRMRRHLQWRLLRGREIDEKDVQLLGLLSDPLRMELHFEMYSPMLNAHPFFHSISEYNYASMRHICHAAIAETTLSRGDTLFSTGDHCERMYLLRCGVLHYQNPSSFAGPRDPDQLIPGEWLSEAVLWTAWTHLGDALASSTTTLVGVNAEKFREVVRRSRTLAPRVAFYAANFVRYLNEAEWAGTLSDLTCSTFNVEAALENAFVMSEEGETPELHNKPSMSLTSSVLLTNGMHGAVQASIQHTIANSLNGCLRAC